MKSSIILFICLLLNFSIYAQETITISGKVTNFNNEPIDSCYVALLNSNFTEAYVAYTNNDGYYSLENVKKGRYMSMYALRLKEYPRSDKVPDEDKRLEFWAWNVIADRDLTINPRYHRLELYGTQVFKVEGGYNGLFIYTRPMSTGKLLNYSKEILHNKDLAEKEADISVKPEFFKAKVYIDGKEVVVNSVQPVQEYTGEKQSVRAFIIQISLPNIKPDKPYVIIRVVAENTEYNEMGENIFFYELKDYKKNTLKK